MDSWLTEDGEVVETTIEELRASFRLPDNGRFYTVFDLPPKVRQVFAEDSSATRQDHLSSVNINSIMKKYKSTGILPAARSDSFYADVSMIGDFREALERVENAENIFMELPAEIRSEFGNDPAEFLDFCVNPDNHDSLVEMGLIAQGEAESEPVDVPQAAEPAGDAAGPPNGGDDPGQDDSGS